ncbi:hypothetical protein SO802_007468 [Lithocarpus litseifolius]|uniref:AT hook motif-containing protein n=1 Tax=Lithocarpus litseifolius TaxID=425828 RepID=A0AAW2DNQ3_9ROSI
MSQQSQNTSSLSPADVPMKRKRGRPRKDESLLSSKKKPATPGPDSIKKNKETVSTSGGGVNDVMVGRMVTGVIEGSFDAGYLLNVKLGDTDTPLRGVVFLPGRFTPISAANDVAPHVKMYNRKDTPIPVFNPQTPVFKSITPSGQSSKQPTRPKIHQHSDQVLPSERQIAIPDALGNQSASVVVPLVANLPKNDAGLSLEGNEVQQQTLEPGLESQSTSIVAQLDHDKVVGCDDVLQKSEASTQIKGPKVDVAATKDSKAKSASEPVVDTVPGVEIVNQEPQIQHQAMSLNPKPSELVHDEVKNSNLEINQTPVFAEPKPFPFELINRPVDNSMEDQASPKKDTAQDSQLELAIETSSGTDAALLNGKPASDPVDVTELVSLSTPRTSEPAVVFDGEVTPESKLAPEGSILPGMIEP